MLKIFFILHVTFIGIILLAKDTHSQEQQEKNSTDGWYLVNKGGFKLNYLGASYTTQLYHKKSLFRSLNPLFFGRSEVNAGFNIDMTSYVRIGGFIDFQPFSFFGIATIVLYEDAWTQLGKPVIVDSVHNYAHAVTGLGQGGNSTRKIDSALLMAQVMPYITLGTPIGEDFIVFVYRSLISYYHFSHVDSKVYIYHSSDNIVIQPQDIHFIHDIMLLYNKEKWGLRFGIVGTLEHIASHNDIWRYGIFALGIYHQPLKRYNKVIPFVTIKAGTWLKDTYYQNNFTILGEIGIKWKIF